jgi:hypothetical protein
MKPAISIGMAVLGIGAMALGACEMSTKNGSVTHPTSDLGSKSDHDTQGSANGPSAQTPRLRRPAIGGGPLVETRQITGAEAMWNIANARCDHEIVCNRIGPSGKYANRDECVAALQKDKGSDFTERSCPDGVSESGLAACIHAIGEETCGKGPSVTRENACLAEKFCSTPVPGTAPGGPGAGASGG